MLAGSNFEVVPNSHDHAEAETYDGCSSGYCCPLFGFANELRHGRMVRMHAVSRRPGTARSHWLRVQVGRIGRVTCACVSTVLRRVHNPNVMRAQTYFTMRRATGACTIRK